MSRRGLHRGLPTPQAGGWALGSVSAQGAVAHLSPSPSGPSCRHCGACTQHNCPHPLAHRSGLGRSRTRCSANYSTSAWSPGPCLGSQRRRSEEQQGLPWVVVRAPSQEETKLRVGQRPQAPGSYLGSGESTGWLTPAHLCSQLGPCQVHPRLSQKALLAGAGHRG